MKSILDIRLKDGNLYSKDSYITKVLDQLKIKRDSPKKIKLLDKEITRVSVPPNYNRNAYFYNISKAIGKSNWNAISIHGNRIYDMNYLNDFQKKILSFAIIKSIAIILSKNKKSIKNSIIAIEDGGNTNNLSIIEECAKYTKRVLLVTCNFNSANKIRRHILLNYGVSPEIVMNKDSIKYVDFIISEKQKSYGDFGVWYLDSFYKPKNENAFLVNDVTLSIDAFNEKFSPEFLGALFNTSSKVNNYIEDFFDSNKILIDEIKFDKKEIEMNCY